jgi:MFS family permease
MSAGALLYGSIPKFEIFLLAEFIFAVGVSLISGADSALLFDSLKEQGRENESNKIFGKAHSFNLLGMFIAAPIGGLIASKFGLNYPVLFTSIPFFITAIVAFTIKEPLIHQDISESTRYLDVIKTGFSYFRHHKILRMLALDAIIVSSSAYFVIWLYQPIFMSLKMPVIYFGLFHALLVASEILVASNFSFLEKIFGSSEKYLKFSAIITGISFLITAIFPNIITGMLFIIIAGGFGLTRLELMTSHMNKFIPSSQRATILSSISMFRRFALVLLNPFIGFTVDHSLRLALLLISVLPFTIFLFSKTKTE